MTTLPILESKRGPHVARFHGSWYRGPHTDFLPSKAELREADAAEKFVLPGWTPAAPFIDRETPITAFGSCFAAHISKHLKDEGYNVFGADLDFSAHIIRFGEGIVNTFAIRQQFEWALGERDFAANLWFGPDKEIAAVTPEIRDQTLGIINRTDLFIITLGLSEIWYDKRSGDAFWRAIPKEMFDDSAHGFRLSSPEENYQNLVEIYRLIRKVSDHAKVVFTLSPIPLMATFRPVSCLTANSVSKAVLRVAIDQFMADNRGDDRVFYFPSYELATELFIDPRQDDNRHIRSEVIAYVMDTFCRHYCISK